MKLTIERAAALAAVGSVRAASPRNVTIPILTYTLLEAGEDGLRVRATDMEVDASAVAAASVSEPGSATVPSEKFHELLRGLPEGCDVALSLEAGRLNVACGRSRYRLPTLPASDFPVRPAPQGGQAGNVSAKGLAKIIERTLFAVAKNDHRPALKGLLLHVVEIAGSRRLRAVATNGHILAYADMPAPDDLASAPATLISAGVAAEMRRQLEGRGDEVTLWTTGKRAALRLGASELDTVLIDYEFPDYPRVIPSGLPKRLSVDPKALIAAAQRCVLVSALGSDKVRPIRVSVAPGEMRLSASDMDGGQGEEVVDVAYDGPDVEMSFNSAYLLSVFSHVEGRASVELGGPRDALVIRDEADPAVLFIIMPIMA